jgi:hypothetical protein
MTKQMTALLVMFLAKISMAQEFRLEGAGGHQTFLHKPAGTVVREDESDHFTSEDAKVDFRIPRFDLVKPSVKSSFDGSTYTYTISNDKTAKSTIAIIRFLKDPAAATEVLSDQRLIFNGGWIAPLNGGIKPGESITVAIRPNNPMASGHVEMQFIGDQPAITLPDDIPYGLQVLLLEHEKVHDHVSVTVAAPK